MEQYLVIGESTTMKITNKININLIKGVIFKYQFNVEN
jgi:hypothetical protein